MHAYLADAAFELPLIIERTNTYDSTYLTC
jgi:hypothetical protein